MAEQTQDVARQQRIKLLAAEADARWDAKPSLSDMPGRERGQALPALDTESTEPSPGWVAPGDAEVWGRKEKVAKDDPWKRASGPSENWQPQAWSPASKR
jgi:NADH dehydrogenase [ubiquinone] 1 alpha subcomplex assembly factor 2